MVLLQVLQVLLVLEAVLRVLVVLEVVLRVLEAVLQGLLTTSTTATTASTTSTRSNATSTIVAYYGTLPENHKTNKTVEGGPSTLAGEHQTT